MALSWIQSSATTTTMTVAFNTAFTRTYTLMLGLDTLEFTPQTDIGYRVQVFDSQPTYFVVTVGKKAATLLMQLGIRWMANCFTVTYTLLNIDFVPQRCNASTSCNQNVQITSYNFANNPAVYEYQTGLALTVSLPASSIGVDFTINQRGLISLSKPSHIVLSHIYISVLIMEQSALAASSFFLYNWKLSINYYSSPYPLGSLWGLYDKNSLFAVLVGYKLAPADCLAYNALISGTNMLDAWVGTDSSTSIFQVLGYAIGHCPAGYLQQIDANGELQCYMCPAWCLTCDPYNVSVCTSCSNIYPTYYAILNSTARTGNCICKPGYVDYRTSFSSAPDCRQCQGNCFTCTGNTTNCTSCRPGYMLYKGKCVEYCIQSLYLSKKGQCEACPQGCSSCSALNCQTVQCSAGLIPFKTSCLSACPSSYYYQPSLPTCVQCLSPCLNCYNLTHCRGCQDGYFFVSQLLACSPCDESCATCSGAGRYECLSCDQGSYLSASGECLYPLRPSDNRAMFFNSTTGNWSGCPAGCLTCHSQTSCESCKKQYFFLNSECKTCDSLYPRAILVNESCTEVCGDGLRILHQCDDGNAVNNDGCSSTCTIEPGYVCEFYLESDFCWMPSHSPHITTQQSYLRNSLLVTVSDVTFSTNKMVSLNLTCTEGPVFTFRYSRLSQTSFSLQIEYYGDFVNTHCTIQNLLATYEFRVQLAPYYMDSTLQTMKWASEFVVSPISYILLGLCLFNIIFGSSNSVRVLYQSLTLVFLELNLHVARAPTIYVFLLPIRLLFFQFYSTELLYQTEYQDTFLSGPRSLLYTTAVSLGACILVLIFFCLCKYFSGRMGAKLLRIIRLSCPCLAVYNFTAGLQPILIYYSCCLLFSRSLSVVDILLIVVVFTVIVANLVMLFVKLKQEGVQLAKILSSKLRSLLLPVLVVVHNSYGFSLIHLPCFVLLNAVNLFYVIFPMIRKSSKGCKSSVHFTCKIINQVFLLGFSAVLCYSVRQSSFMGIGLSVVLAYAVSVMFVSTAGIASVVTIHRIYRICRLKSEDLESKPKMDCILVPPVSQDDSSVTADPSNARQRRLLRIKQTRRLSNQSLAKDLGRTADSFFSYDRPTCIDDLVNQIVEFKAQDLA